MSMVPASVATTLSLEPCPSPQRESRQWEGLADRDKVVEIMVFLSFFIKIDNYVKLE